MNRFSDYLKTRELSGNKELGPGRGRGIQERDLGEHCNIRRKAKGGESFKILSLLQSCRPNARVLTREQPQLLNVLVSA